MPNIETKKQDKKKLNEQSRTLLTALRGTKKNLAEITHPKIGGKPKKKEDA